MFVIRERLYAHPVNSVGRVPSLRWMQHKSHTEILARNIIGSVRVKSSEM